MENIILFLSLFLILPPIILFVLNRKFFYYSLIILYPIVGQLISVKIEIFGFTINPSMLFGLLVLAMTAIDFILCPSEDSVLEIAVVLFILYSIFTSLLSPVRFLSLTWSLKIATWLLILLSSIKIFSEENDLYQIKIAVCFAVMIVALSFLLSKLGYYGRSLTYETGVVLHGGGFESGKVFGYYLAMAMPILLTSSSNRNILDQFLSAFLLLTSATVIVLTFVRAPIVALLIGFMAYQYFSYRYADKKFGSTAVTIVAIIVLIVVAYLSFGDTELMSRWSELGNKYSEGKVEKLGSGRVGIFMSFVEYYVYKAGLIQKIFGSGLGSSVVYLGHNLVIHNGFAEILMGCGIIGFSLYIIIIVRMLRTFTKQVAGLNASPMRKHSLFALSNFFIFLSFHLTNLTSGVFILSMWAIYTGATLGIGRALMGNKYGPANQPFNDGYRTDRPG
jgi:hypothetical protein